MKIILDVNGERVDRIFRCITRCRAFRIHAGPPALMPQYSAPSSASRPTGCPWCGASVKRRVRGSRPDDDSGRGALTLWPLAMDFVDAEDLAALQQRSGMHPFGQGSVYAYEGRPRIFAERCS